MFRRRTYTTGEVAQFCNVHFRTVIRWVERGELKAYVLPGRGDKRIEPADLIAFMTKNHFPLPEALAAFTNRVLIVDDDPAMARAIERVLKRLGFVTQIAGDGFQAGAALGSELPALLILDLNMPGLNGFQVLEMIRANPRYEVLKVLVVSAMPANSLQQALAAGANDTLEKPFRNEHLIEKVSALMNMAIPAHASDLEGDP